MKMKLFIGTALLAALVTSSKARAQTVNCAGGSGFPSTVTIGRITYTASEASICQLLAQNQNAGFAGPVEVAQSIRVTAAENIARALESFQWRDPVVYAQVMQQLGLKVTPKEQNQ